MISIDALFKISYGLFIVSSGDKSKGNGFISNTVFQVTAEPVQFAVCCNKDNFTAGVIIETGNFAVSVLHEETDPEIFGRFGYKSGKDFDKLKGMNLVYGETGVPIVLNDSVAWFECRVKQTTDVGTHLIFIGELVQAVLTDDIKEPITYSYYRKIRKGVAPKNAPTYIDKSKLEKQKQDSLYKKYKCGACGTIYDESIENIRFSDLPDNWVCPTCGSEKTEFFEINN
jgi:flavin reductase (DIM6/NTAB) family NADH-FMN oxidoreductase RutF/rubredoxin